MQPCTFVEEPRTAVTGSHGRGSRRGVTASAPIGASQVQSLLVKQAHPSTRFFAAEAVHRPRVTGQQERLPQSRNARRSACPANTR